MQGDPSSSSQDEDPPQDPQNEQDQGGGQDHGDDHDQGNNQDQEQDGGGDDHQDEQQEEQEEDAPRPQQPRVRQSIQKDHPVDNILGDIQKGVTTRSRVANFCHHYSFVFGAS